MAGRHGPAVRGHQPEPGPLLPCLGAAPRGPRAHVPLRSPRGSPEPRVPLHGAPGRHGRLAAGVSPGLPRLPLELQLARGGAGGGRGSPGPSGPGGLHAELPAAAAQPQRALLLPGAGRPRHRALLRHLRQSRGARAGAVPAAVGCHQEQDPDGAGSAAAALRGGAGAAAALQEALGQRAAPPAQENLPRGRKSLRGAEPGRVLHVRGHFPGGPAHLPGRGDPPCRRRPPGEALKRPP